MGVPSPVTKAHYVYFYWCRCTHRHTCTVFPLGLLTEIAVKRFQPLVLGGLDFFARVQTTSLYERATEMFAPVHPTIVDLCCAAFDGWLRHRSADREQRGSFSEGCPPQRRGPL